MKPMKFKKISDEDNIFGFDEIILIEKSVSGVRIRTPTDDEKRDSPGANERRFYDYQYSAIADGEFITINEDEFMATSHAYKFVGFFECER